MSIVTLDYQGEIAIVRINSPPVNALSHALRAQLLDAIISLDDNGQVKAVVLICEGRTFIAGADIKEFGKPVQEPHLPDVIHRLEAARKPWIAAIHGTALGGGFEVTLGCHYRIAVPSAKLGLPEVNLGLIPGAGGTVRLPRLIAAKEAVRMVSSGKPISANAAHQLAILDLVVPDGETLETAAVNFAKGVISNALPQALSLRQPVQNMDDSQWEEQIAAVTKKARGQISPVEAARAVEQACSLDANEAFTRERERFVKLRNSSQSAALRYTFFAERQTAKVARLENVSAKSIDHCGVLGGGTMGAGIAASILLAGKKVTMVERDSDALDAGLQRVGAILATSHKRGLISAAKLEAFSANLNGSISHEELAECDLVIEAIFEDMAIKKQVFASLDTQTRPDCLLASNTSYLDINEIAASVANPGRVLGLHFFSPAHIMKLVEVVAGDKVDNQTLATGFAFAKTLRKVPVLSGVCEGFIANRIMSAYRKACDYMLEDGCLPQQIDHAMKQFGLPMGMYEMADMAGLDIGWATRKRLAPTRPPEERYVRIADRLCELGRFGQKTGSGWYQYSYGSRVGMLDPLVHLIVEEESALKNITRRDFSDAEIMVNILGAMTSEANRLLEEGIAQRASDIDMVMILGYGFPRWRGGPMFMADNPS